MCFCEHAVNHWLNLKTVKSFRKERLSKAVPDLHLYTSNSVSTLVWRAYGPFSNEVKEFNEQAKTTMWDRKIIVLFVDGCLKFKWVSAYQRCMVSCKKPWIRGSHSKMYGVTGQIWILPVGAKLICVKWSNCTGTILLRPRGLQRPDIVLRPKEESLKIQNCLCSLHQSLEMWGRGERGARFDIFVWDLISSLYIFYQKPAPSLP